MFQLHFRSISMQSLSTHILSLLPWELRKYTRPLIINREFLLSGPHLCCGMGSLAHELQGYAYWQHI